MPFILHARREKAARGALPEARRYPWGDEWKPGICNTCELELNDTTSVHEFEQTNQSPFGVVDMAGNLWEWCCNLYVSYPYIGTDGREVLEGNGLRVLRGGALGVDQRLARTASRHKYFPHYRSGGWGCRIGVTISSLPPPSIGKEEPP